MNILIAFLFIISFVSPPLSKYAHPLAELRQICTLSYRSVARHCGRISPLLPADIPVLAYRYLRLYPQISSPVDTDIIVHGHRHPRPQAACMAACGRRFIGVYPRESKGLHIRENAYFPRRIRLMSFNLFSASSGVRLLTSRFRISSRIWQRTGSSS